MKQNLFVTSFDYDLSKQVAKVLADEFSMRFFDQKELFEFDHLPRTFGDVCESFGVEYVKKKFRSILKMELDFDDAVFVSDMCFVDNCEDIFYKIKLSNFVILLKKDIDEELDCLNSKNIETEAEKVFCVQSKEALTRREKVIETEIADVVVDVSNKEIEQIVSEIIDKIKEYYLVN